MINLPLTGHFKQKNIFWNDLLKKVKPDYTYDLLRINDEKKYSI